MINVKTRKVRHLCLSAETNNMEKYPLLDHRVLRRFEEFFETQEISGYKAFQKDSFE